MKNGKPKRVTHDWFIIGEFLFSDYLHVYSLFDKISRYPYFLQIFSIRILEQNFLKWENFFQCGWENFLQIGPWEPVFWLTFLLETRQWSESLEHMIGFLAFLAQKLWPKKQNLGKDRARCPMTSAKNAKTYRFVTSPTKTRNPKLSNFLQCKLEDVCLVLTVWTGLLLNRLASCRVTNWREKNGLNAVSTWVFEAAAGAKNFRCHLCVQIQGVHKVLHTLKIFISQKPHKVETLHFRQWIILP